MTDKIGSNRSGIYSDDTDTSDTSDFTVVATKADRDINRKVLPKDVRNYAQQRDNVLMWETDPQTQRDYADNSIVQAFIDTLAKDVSSIEWSIINDEGDTKDEIKEFFEQAHPTKTYRDMLEATVRDLLEVGNAFWVIHRYENSNEPAEIVMPDASTMFKVVDDDGFVTGYAQKTTGSKSEVIDKDNVIHFEWASSSDRNYARSPVETTMNQIDIIEELLLKEQLDLTEGGVSSIVSQTDDHETNPLSNKEWKTLKNQINQQEGARHVNVITRGSFEQTQIGTSYEEMDILNRYKTHIQTISSAFKIPASYAGLDYENTNRATDVNQSENYKQKGIKIVIQQLKSKINKDLIPQLADDPDVRYSWSLETDRDLDQVNYYEQLAKAVQELKNAGIPFEVSENNISIPEGAEVTLDELQKVEEASVLAELSEEDVKEIIEQQDTVSNKDDSVENWKEFEYTSTERKEELAECMDCDYRKALIKIEDESDTRQDAFKRTQDMLSGSMSKSTYYEWLSELGLK